VKIDEMKCHKTITPIELLLRKKVTLQIMISDDIYLFIADNQQFKTHIFYKKNNPLRKVPSNFNI